MNTMVSEGLVYVYNRLVRADVWIENGKIAAIGTRSSMPKADHVIEANGKLVIPGLIDTHAHFRDPGFTQKEDFETGTKAAAAGGITLAVDMPNVNPPPNTAERFIAHRENAKRKAVVDFSHNAAGTIVEEIPKIAAAGPPMGFKIFMISDVGRDYPHMPGIGVADHGQLLTLFEAISKTGIVCLVHPWDQQIWEQISKKYRDSGKTDFRFYAKAFREYDSVMHDSGVATLVELQRVTGVKLQVLHTTTRRAFDLVKQAKKAGQAITTEVNPHAVFLGNDWQNVEKLGPYSLGAWTPEKDAEATWQALVDGEADVIATDHAPHTKAEKEIGWTDMWRAPGGSPSIEWYLSLLLTEVNKGRISLDRVVKLCSENPARIFGVYPRKGSIQVGSDADLVIVDMNKEEVLSGDKMYTKCGWNPYAGRKVKGEPVLTMVRGTVVMQDGQVIGKPGYGQYVAPTVRKTELDNSR
jgi:dihydroorotase (multifunctional complex type)